MKNKKVLMIYNKIQLHHLILSQMKRTMKINKYKNKILSNN